MATTSFKNYVKKTQNGDTITERIAKIENQTKIGFHSLMNAYNGRMSKPVADKLNATLKTRFRADAKITTAPQRKVARNANRLLSGAALTIEVTHAQAYQMAGLYLQNFLGAHAK